MIGMSQIKKKIFQGLGIGLAVGVVGIGLTVWWALATTKSYENGTNKGYNEKYTKEVTVLTRDILQGETITSDMVTTFRVHIKSVPNDVASAIAGKVAKFNLAANVPLTNSMLTDELMSADIRNQEINTAVLPTDLNEGENVDVRIMFPNGTDYVVLAQKKVTKIVGQTMWLNISEAERLLLSSAMVDSYLRPGTKLYATKYVDDSQIVLDIADDTGDNANTAKGFVMNEIQKQMELIKTATAEETTNLLFDMILKYKNFAATSSKITENYQPNSQVIAMMRTNQNVLEQAKTKLSEAARANMENGLNSYESTAGDKYTNVITGAQQSITAQKDQRTAILNGEI